MANVQTISRQELKRRLEQGNDFQFWNVLTDEYFNGEMIPGSRRVPLDRVGREVTQTQLPKAAEVVVYCGGPNCPQSVLAAQKLVELGYTAVRAYEGGLEEWKNTGHAVTRLEEVSAA